MKPLRPHILAARSSFLASPSAFTLFELILAIALSATLLALVGTAINLYLMRVDASRTRVEEAQLARGILAMIAADVRAATGYQTQDISAIAQLASSSTAFDANTIDKSGTFKGSALGTSSGSGSSGSGSSGASGNTGTSTSPSASSGQSSMGDNQNQSTTSVPGLNGTLNELFLDVSRLPRLDELSSANTQQSSATAASATKAPRPSDTKTIRYFIREGEAIDPSDVAATSLSPEAQARAGGLVRQSIDRAVRTLAEQSGDQAVLDGGQALIAPEVVDVEFRYYDGSEGVEEWNMQERGSLPRAIEVRIWFADTESSAEAGASRASVGSTSQLTAGRMYSETIDLPLAQSAGASGTAAAGSGGDASSGSGSGGSGSGSGSGSGTGGPGTGGSQRNSQSKGPQ